ncbi:MAG TPA: VWA domain-containing protein [Vicinamibacterales bacterium]|nr:VWA domain-containing protein [Vicinamibacterales bacterium]
MPHARISHAAVALVCAVLGASLAGQQQPPTAPPPAQEQPPAPPGQQPVFRTGINFVRVDAIVTDKQGTPIIDLKQTDFEVLEDGKPQTLETFRVVKVDTTAPNETRAAIRTRADEERAAADDNARIFVFFLDDYHVRLGNSMASRKPLIQFVQNNLGPNDLVAVMLPLSPLESVSLTRDHQAVIRMLEKFEGRKFNYEPRNDLEQRYALYPAETVERIRRQVSLSALEGLAIKLGALREGRKAVIVVSEGYTTILPPQLRDPVASMPGMGNPARRNPTLGENSINEERADMSGQLDVQREMQEVFSAANRSNTALYTVDPRGLATGEFDINENVGMQRSSASLRQTQDTLRVLADETDGRAIVNRNDLARAMKQIVVDSSAYYLLGYNSSQAPQDGKFHEIKVRVKRPGAQVRARKGYWALTPVETARAAAASTPKAGPPPAVNKALSSIAEPSRGRFVRTWVGTSRGEAGKTKVTFVWEPLPAQPGLRRENATSVALIAASPDGETLFRGQVPAAGSTGTSVTFDVPPGRVQLRMSVNGAAGALDSDDREVIVPDLTAAELSVATPRVFVARNALELRTLNGDVNAMPTAGREFRRTDRLIIRTEIYAPGTASAVVTSRLLNKQGQRLADVPVTAPAGSAQPHVIDLPLAALAPGEYLLELNAASAGQPPAQSLVAFRIVG